MTGLARPFFILPLITLALAGCGSSRLGGPGPEPRGPRVAYNAPAPQAEPEPVVAIPSGSVSSEPLAPPPGASAAPSSPVVSDVPPMSGAPMGGGPVDTPPRQQVASITPPAASGSRSSAIGGWTAREAGGTCRVQLSSSPALDLYKASAAGCSNKELSKITAWDFRNGEVYLYQPGGAVTARLRSAGGSLDGVLAKSGAPLTLSR